jgi:hypothetical protein
MSVRSLLLESFEAKARITSLDVLTARSMLFADGVISPDEAEALFRVNDAVPETCPEWRALFVEALTDYLVRQQEPTGYIDTAKAGWLMARIAADGRVRGDTELELLIYSLEQAFQAPEALSRYALQQAAQIAHRPEGEGGGLTAFNVARIRRALYAFAGAGGAAAVSRQEAETLFDLNDAARGQPVDAAWTELFTKAIGAAVMQASGYRPPSRDEAARREAWLKAPTPGVGGVLAGALRSVLKGGLADAARTAWKDDADAAYEAQYAEFEDAAEAAAPVDEAEARWIASRIGRDGLLDDNEKALLRFLKAEAPSIHPALQPLLAAAA